MVMDGKLIVGEDNMILISDFADYYDCMNFAFGNDKSNKFVRDTKQKSFITYTQLNQNLYDVLGWLNYNKYDKERVDYQVNQVLVFCDEVYLLTSKTRLCIKPYSRYIDDAFIKDEDNFLNKWSVSRTKGYMAAKNNAQELRKFHNAPYFIISRPTKPIRDYHKREWDYIIEIPCLKDIDFHLIKDANQCYQDIEMWLSANTHKDIPQEVSNDVRVQQHGFDLKQSFRTRKD